MNKISELIMKIREKKVILWVGAGFSLYAGMPSALTLVNAIINQSTDEEKDILRSVTKTLQDVSEEFVLLRSDNKNDLIKILEKEIMINPKDLSIHEMLRQIPQINEIITTNYDTLFEQAYMDKLIVIPNSFLLPFSTDVHKVRLYKIHGDFSYPESIIITKTDYVNHFAFQQDEPIWSIVKSFLAKYSILFIGYSLEDENVKSIFSAIDDKLGGFRNKCYFVSPRLPKHRQDYLAKKNIEYIDMTGEEIIPIIHKEIQKHMIEDLQRGYLHHTDVCHILNEYNIGANFNIQSDGTLYLKSVQCADSAIKGSIKFNNDYQLPMEDLQAFMHGLNFNSVKISKGSISSLKTYLKGFELPIVNDVESIELELKAIPKKTFECSFLLKNSGQALSDIQGNIYCSPYLIQLDFNHKYVLLSFKFKVMDGGGTDFNFETATNIDVIEAKQIYSFINEWLQGDEIIILCNEGTKIPNVPSPTEVTDDLKNKVNYLSSFYSDLFEIQKYFGVVFDAINEITENDLNNMNYILAAIRKNTLTLNNLTMKITPSIDDFESIISEDGFAVKFVMKEPKPVKLFGKIFTLREGQVNCNDAYVINKTEVIEFYRRGEIPIPMVLGSKGNGLNFTWIA